MNSFLNVSDDLFKKFLDEDRLNQGSFIFHAIKKEKLDIIRTLLHLGADPSSRSHNNLDEISISEDVKQVFLTSTLSALAISDTKKVEHMLDSGFVDINDLDSSQNSLLHWAASYSNADTVNLLLRRGAKVNRVAPKSGVTPLHEAVKRKSEEIAKILLQNGANLYANSKALDETPLDLIRKSDFHWSSSFLSGLNIISNGEVHEEEEKEEEVKVNHVDPSPHLQGDYYRVSLSKLNLHQDVKVKPILMHTSLNSILLAI